MGNLDFTDNQFTDIVKECNTMGQVVRALHLRSSGTAYKAIRKRIERLNLDTSHWIDVGVGRQQPTKALEDILVKDSDYLFSTSLKGRLIRAGLLEYRCYSCGVVEWQGVSLALHIDHINGQRTDHRLENLRLLCPNCHSITPTFGNRNKDKRNVEKFIEVSNVRKKQRKMHKNECVICSKGITKAATHCKSCSGKLREKTKIDWPPVIELFQMVKESSYTEVGKRLGVSDNAVRRRLVRYIT